MSTRSAVRRLAAIGILGVLALSSAVTPSPAAAAPRPAVLPATRLFMVSDSVGLGAVSALKSAFGSGWQVTVTGKPGLFTEQLTTYVQQAPAAAFGESAVVATGYNYPYWDPPRFARSVDGMVAALKAKGVTRIYWVTMREVKPAYYSKWNGLTVPYRTLYLAYPTANDVLRTALARHPELSIVDWAAISDMNGLTYDAIHLNPTGAAKYARLVRDTVVSGRTRPAARTVTRVAVGGVRVPATAAAATVNLTVTNPRTAGFVSAYSCDEPRPTLTNVWFAPNQTVSGTAVVPLGASGEVCLYQSTAAHVALDLTGYVPDGEGFTATAVRRALDTRTGALPAAGATVVARLGNLAGVPAGPFTAIVSVTSAAAAGGDVRVFTCGTTPPATPARSVATRATASVLQLVRTDAAGNVCVQFTGRAHHTVDLVGALPTSAGLTPVRARRVYTSGADPLRPGTTRVVKVAGVVGSAVPAAPTTVGAFLTVTINPADQGAVTMFRCTSTTPRRLFVHGVPNHPQTNAGLTEVGADGTVCLRSSVTSAVTVDVSGWSGTALVPVAPSRLLSTLG